jgi:hypothetical protein
MAMPAMQLEGRRRSHGGVTSKTLSKKIVPLKKEYPRAMPFEIQWLMVVASHSVRAGYCNITTRASCWLHNRNLSFDNAFATRCNDRFILRT